MENNAPTAAGPTPDSEDNNNGSEKESPSPRIIESTTTENVVENGVKDEQMTPDSAVGGVTNEGSDEVTIESKPPGVEDSVSPEERENSEVGEETAGNEKKKQDEDPTEENEGTINEKQEEEKPSEPQAETNPEVPAEETETAEVMSESKVEAQSEEKAKGEEEEKVEASLDPETGKLDPETDPETGKLDPVTENAPEPEPDKTGPVGDSEEQEKGAIAEDSQGFETSGEDRVGESQDESRQENNDTSSSVTKAEEGYSADNEATTTAASIDTGEPSQSGFVLEKDEVQGDSAETTEVKSHPEEKTPDESDKKDEERTQIEEPQMNYEELLTKYHATELQLDGLRDEKKELEAKIKDLQNQIDQFHESKEQDKQKQRDGYMVQADFLARELNQTQDAEKFLKEKVAELLEEKEESEKKVRDLQLRLKRFSKDDKAKDERIAKMESELKEITEEVQELETYLDEETKVKIREKRSSTRGSTVSAGNSHTKVTDMNKMNTNRSHRDPEPVQRSRTCSII